MEQTNEKQKSSLLKLGRQFAHPPKRKLVPLLKDAGAWKGSFDEDLIQTESTCVLCKTYAKTRPKPVVALPSAKEFNEKVAMDLKQYKSRDEKLGWHLWNYGGYHD